MREALALGPLGERQAPEAAKYPGLGKSPDPSGVGTPLSSVLTYSVWHPDVKVHYHNHDPHDFFHMDTDSHSQHSCPIHENWAQV